MAACTWMPAEPRVVASRAGGAGGAVRSAKDIPPLSSSSLTASSPWLVGGLLSDSAARVAVAASALKGVE